MEAFDRLHKEGKIRYIGASNYLAWRLEEVRWKSLENGWPDFCCIQQRYTYLRKKPGTSFDPQVAVNNDLIDYCSNRKISLLAYSALLSGAYTRKDREFPASYRSPDSDNRLEVLKSVTRELNATPNQVILAWMLQSNPLVLPLIAASSADQLDENINALEIKLSPEQMKRLNEAGS